MIDLKKIQGRGLTSQRTRDRLVSSLQEKGITNEKLLNSFATVPRHLFVEEALSDRSYEETALPIGYQQTISKPYTVARMTSLLLESKLPVRRVLEIGTGSGYQTAILSCVTFYVYTIERVYTLYQHAKQLLSNLNYSNITCLHGDGQKGYLKGALYDGILVTASAPIGFQHESLLSQIKEGGRLVIPMTIDQDNQQQLYCFEKESNQNYREILKEPTRFVPLLPNIT